MANIIFIGTNAHIILDDAMNYMSDRGISGNHSSVDLSQPSSPATTGSWVEVNNLLTEKEASWPSDYNSPARLYVLTAHEESGIARLSSAYSDYFIKRNLSGLRESEVSKFGTNLAYTLSNRRSKLPWKAYVVSSTPENLSTQFHDDLSKPKRSSQSPIIAFAFSGQGAQFWSMGRELLQYEVFSNCLNTADSYLRSLGCEWSLMTEFLKDEEKSIIDLPRISQPLSTALQIALVDLLEHWGVKPSSVVGHSSGEIAAAYTLGAITREAAWKLSYHRGRLTSAIKYLAPNLKGRMMAVALSSGNTAELLADVKEGNAIVGCINSPENVTVSGDEVAVLSLETTLKSRGIFARLLKVENAYHSFHMKIIERHYLQSINGIQIHEAQQGRTMFSSVTGKAISPGDLGHLYWAQNLVSPVQFSDAFTSLLQSKRVRPDVILEIGPHGVLQGPMKQIIDAKSKSKLKPSCLSILSRGKNAVVTSLQAVGHLWSVGCPVDLNRVNAR
jgi:acyl transferase domain-containing protein